MHGTLLGWLPYTADDYGGKYDQNPFGGQYFSAEATYLPAARAPDRGVVSLAVSEDGNRLAIGAEDGFVEVWEVRGFQLAARAKLHEGRVYSVALNNNGRIVASAGRDGKVVATRTDPDPKFGIAPAATRETLTATRSFPLPDVRKVVFLPDQHIVASTKSGTLAAITVDELPAVPTPSPTAQFNAPVDTDY
jgi:WD40 repeat protein